MTSYTYDDEYNTQLTKEYKRDGSTTDEKGNVTYTKYEEYETSGISYYDSNGNYVDCANWRMTENALRREQGMWRRMVY